jgi:hypothetical protein
MSVVKTVVTVAVAAAVSALSIAPIVWTAPVAAATLTAASCSYSDVNAVVGAAVDGDTVVVPAGSCAWNGGLVISKAITLKGAGIGQTLITDNFTSGNLITLIEATTGNIRIQGFEFSPGAGPTDGNSYYIKVGASANGRPVLITANKWTLGGNALRVETNRGVIWNNIFDGTVSLGGSNCLNNAAALRHYPIGLTTSWTTPAKYGTADTNGDQTLYFESNTMTNVLEGVDVAFNGRLVFRYNTVSNSGFVHHGADTGNIGARYTELYNNTFIFDQTVRCAPDLPTGVNSFIYLRGGTALIHDNTIPDVISRAWGDKSEVNFIDEKLRRNSSTWACWKGGYPTPYQVGWGYTTGGTQSGTSGVYMDIEPVYIWNNVGGGNYNNPGIGDFSCGDPQACADCATDPSSADVIKINREYFVNTAKPGYTPFVYPHPLTGSQSSSSPVSPTNLSVR